MTLVEAIALIQQTIGFRTDLDSEITTWLDRAQELLEQGVTLPQWLKTESGTITGLANDSVGVLPDGFIRFDNNDTVTVRDVNGKRYTIARVDYNDLIEVGTDDDTGDDLEGFPTALTLRKATVVVRPVPTAAWSLTGSWFAHDVLPSDAGTTNLWLTNAPLVLCGKAGQLIAANLEHPTAPARFNAMYSEASQRLFFDVVEREQSGDDSLQVGAYQ